MSKRRWLIALSGLNLVLAGLLAGLVAGGPLIPRPAFADDPPAQPPVGPPPPLSSRYLAVAGEMQDQYDAVYLLDTRERAIHVFVYDRSLRRLGYVAARDLDQDFRGR